MVDDDDRAVIVYGSSWCGFTQYVLRQLQELEIHYRFVDIDENPGDRQRITDWNQGQLVRPTLDLNGLILFNPDPTTLRSTLRNQGLWHNSK